VLERARGQSVISTLVGASSGADECVEYTFGGTAQRAQLPQTDWTRYAKTSGPPFGLELEHVIGYNGHDELCRENVHCLGARLVYNVGTVGVVHDIESNAQLLCTAHTAPITSLTTVGRNLVATASCDAQSVSIRVWSADDLKVAHSVDFEVDGFAAAVRHLRFSSVSKLLFCTTKQRLLAFELGDDDSSLERVVDCNLAASSKSKNQRVLGIAIQHKASDDGDVLDELVVFGSNLLVWCSLYKAHNVGTTRVQKLPPKCATDGKKEKAFLCGTFISRTRDEYVLGGQSGTLYIGRRENLIAAIAGHTGRLQSLQIADPKQFQVFSVGAEDGAWKLWQLKIDSDSGDASVLCEDTFVPKHTAISRAAHSAFYSASRQTLFVGTTCNSLVSVSGIHPKNGGHVVSVVSAAHGLGIVGMASSPKLDSLIATLSEDGLLRLWNFKTDKSRDNPRRGDDCVAWLALDTDVGTRRQCRATTMAWSPDGKFIASGFSANRVTVCTAHPLRKQQDLRVDAKKREQVTIDALCFSYSHNVLAVAVTVSSTSDAKGQRHRVELFTVQRKATKWERALSVSRAVSRLYFSEDDDVLAVVCVGYETQFYALSVPERRVVEDAECVPRSSVVWWPRIPMTSFVLKGVGSEVTPLCDVDVDVEKRVCVSADEAGVLTLRSLPALEKARERSSKRYRQHYGRVAQVLFIADQDRLVSVGRSDRTILRWAVRPNGN